MIICAGFSARLFHCQQTLFYPYGRNPLQGAALAKPHSMRDVRELTARRVIQQILQIIIFIIQQTLYVFLLIITQFVGLTH